MTAGIDLHIHTTASDGRFSPQQIVDKAARLGLGVVAICDHDTIDGIAPALEAARAWPQPTVIPGVEISTFAPGNEVHILGYFIDYNNPRLKTALAELRNSRQERAQTMIARLKKLNIDINWQQVQQLAGGGAVGRPHIAQVMLEKGYITSFTEAFDKYIGQGGSAYVEREKMTPAEAVEMIVRAKGLPVLAHPFTVTDPEATVTELKPAGLVGIEAYYKDYSTDEIENLVSMAEKYDLIATGGTDYHGLDDSSEIMLGGVDVPLESVEKLIALADK